MEGQTVTITYAGTKKVKSVKAVKKAAAKPAANVDFSAEGKVDVSDYIGVANYILTGSIYGNGSMTRVK